MLGGGTDEAAELESAMVNVGELGGIAMVDVEELEGGTVDNGQLSGGIADVGELESTCISQPSSDSSSLSPAHNSFP